MGSDVDVAAALELAEARAIMLFASAEFLDVATTIIGLRSGRFVEGNPVASARTDLLMTLKLLVILAIVLLVHRFVSPGRRAAALVVMATIAMVAPMLNAAHIIAGG